MREGTDNAAEDLAILPKPRPQRTALAVYPASGPNTYRVPLDSLLPGDSPRLVGEDAEHIRVLAQPDRPLPPILVHRPTMRVIDGMHRIGAARLRGEDTIEAVFFDGSDDDAFVMAVRSNIAHGLPLSFADREAAVARIITAHPDWSDRAIAAATGLAAQTVAGVRGRIIGLPSATARIGRDGRIRPLDSTDGRRVASRLIAARPDASLREIARSSGISPATVRDVRARLQRGEDPVPQRRPRAERPIRPLSGPERAEIGPAPCQDEPEGLSAKDRNAVLQNLERDPSLRFARSGHLVLRWLARRVIAGEEWRNVADAVPPHSAYIIAALARRCAREWLEFAKQLEHRLGGK
ncbi:ParB/RepB/Spo0J family partition protein [Actinocrispum wychmicini]|uniref:ParB/RepB/Spo0J family partition protein n=1 Tax=Actinocrispum wychmicini TaxID=1213861 RepID=UPI001FB57446|nr:ParB/RepB/Spo0J family partition protein [Actinocrispum wychmicini]